MNEPTFDTIPSTPMPLMVSWLQHAERESSLKNWNVMYIATSTADGHPSVRPVLHKHYDESDGSIVFFTNYNSRKAREMAENSHVAATLHWDHLERQVRLEGTTIKASAEVSDAYFAKRHPDSQIGAWASAQSENLSGVDELERRVAEIEARFAGQPIPRPPHWGGYVLRPTSVEFWIGRPGRVHHRIRYSREDASDSSAWSMTWLFP